MLCRVVAYCGPGLPRPTTSWGSAIAEENLLGFPRRVPLRRPRPRPRRSPSGASTSACLGDLARTLGLEVFLCRRGDDVDDEHLRIRHQRDTLRQFHCAGGELGADLGALDGDGELFGDRLRSASISMVLASWVTSVSEAASPSTTTLTSTVTFSPRRTTSRSRG